MNPTPKVMRYRDAVADAERRIVEALPDILDALVAQAKSGDVRAALYLLDRVLGRPAGSKHAPADDTSLPFEVDDLAASLRNRERFRAMS